MTAPNLPIWSDGPAAEAASRHDARKGLPVANEISFLLNETSLRSD